MRSKEIEIKTIFPTQPGLKRFALIFQQHTTPTIEQIVLMQLGGSLSIS